MRLGRRGLIITGAASIFGSLLPMGQAQADPSRAQYLQLGMLTVPVIRDGRVHGQLHVSAQIELMHAGLAPEAHRRMPRLIHGLLMELTEIVARTPASEPMPGVERIRRRVQVTAERVLGEGTVRAVHMQNQSVHVPS